MGKRYTTYFGYFGPKSNVQDAPAELTGDVVAQLLGIVPAREQIRGKQGFVIVDEYSGIAPAPVRLATRDGEEVSEA